MIWILALTLSIVTFIIGIIYLSNRIRKFGIKNKLLPYLIIILYTFMLTLLLNFTTAIIIIIHYLIIWLILDLIVLLVKRFRKKSSKYYISGILTLIIVPIFVLIGIYNVYNVTETTYNFKTDKLKNSYTLALISDSHMGTTFNADKFNKYLKEIESKNIDALLIAGDFVDDGTTKEDMIKSIEYLGKIKTKYGIHFAHGNHDKGYYGEKRGYSVNDLENTLTENGIHVLKDESALINDEIYIIGRKDYEDQTRNQINKLIEDLDKNKYMLVLDHQPTDYTSESKSGVDLVLSGHTHGGQLIPLNLLNKPLSENDNVYGYKKVGKTDFIVTSGISDWEIKMKTGTKSEYVIININN